MLREPGRRNIESAPVGAIQNVLLSQHGFIVCSPQRTSPQGDGSCGQRYTSCNLPQIWDSAHFRRIPQMTALDVRPTENGRRCADTCSGAPLPTQKILNNGELWRTIVNRSEQGSSDRATRLPCERGQASRDLSAAVAVFDCATFAHPRPTERHEVRDSRFVTRDS